MKSISVVVIAVAAVGVLAKPQPNTGYQSNGFNCCHGGYGSSIPVLNAHLQTSTVENPTVSFPSYIPPTSVSDTYHCLRTLVRPQLRNEIITVPNVDRIVRTVTNPVVETINCGGNTRLTTYPTNGIQSEGQGNSQAIATNSYYSGGNAANSHNLNAAATANRATATLLATPTSIFTYHTSGAANTPTNAFSGNSAYANSGRINSF